MSTVLIVEFRKIAERALRKQGSEVILLAVLYPNEKHTRFFIPAVSDAGKTQANIIIKNLCAEGIYNKEAPLSGDKLFPHHGKLFLKNLKLSFDDARGHVIIDSHPRDVDDTILVGVVEYEAGALV